MGPADLVGKRNVEVDRKATALRDQLESEGRVQARNPRFFSEPCAIFVRGEKLASLDRTIIEDLIVLPQLEEDWQDQRNLTSEAIQLVDWQVVQRSMKSLPAGIQRWCTKHVAGMCGVGKFRELWGLDDQNRCPLCSLAEDHHHVPLCGDPRVLKEWNIRVDELRLWLEHSATAPYIQCSLLSLLARVGEPLSPLWQDWQLLPWELQRTVLSAQTAQDIIGPQGLLEGLLSSEWAPIQEAHFRSLGSRRSGTTEPATHYGWFPSVDPPKFRSTLGRQCPKSSGRTHYGRGHSETIPLGVQRPASQRERTISPPRQRSARAAFTSTGSLVELGQTGTRTSRAPLECSTQDDL